jgi:hypothetical protein
LCVYIDFRCVLEERSDFWIKEWKNKDWCFTKKQKFETYIDEVSISLSLSHSLSIEAGG